LELHKTTKFRRLQQLVLRQPLEQLQLREQLRLDNSASESLPWDNLQPLVPTALLRHHHSKVRLKLDTQLELERMRVHHNMVPELVHSKALELGNT